MKYTEEKILQSDSRHQLPNQEQQGKDVELSLGYGEKPDLAAGENPGVVVAIEDAASNRYLAALDEDGEEACLEAATNFISEHKMGLKDEGLGRIARYAIGYTGCVEIDGGYHDALLVSFFETTLESGFSAYVLYEGMGAGDGFMWSDPEPAGEETPLI